MAISTNYQNQIVNTQSSSEIDGTNNNSYINSTFDVPSNENSTTDNTPNVEINTQTQQINTNNSSVKNEADLLKKFDNEFKKLGLNLTKQEQIQFFMQFTGIKSIEELFNYDENFYTEIISKMNEIHRTLTDKNEKITVEKILATKTLIETENIKKAAGNTHKTTNETIQQLMERFFGDVKKVGWNNLDDTKKIHYIKRFVTAYAKKNNNSQINTFINRFIDSSPEDRRLMLCAVEALNAENREKGINITLTGFLTDAEKTMTLSREVEEGNLNILNITTGSVAEYKEGTFKLEAQDKESAERTTYTLARHLNTDATKVFANQLNEMKEEVFPIFSKVKAGEELSTEENEILKKFGSEIQDVYNALMGTNSANNVAISQNKNLEEDFAKQLVTQNLANDKQYGEDIYRETLSEIYNFVHDEKNQEKFGFNEENISSFMNETSNNNYDIIIQDVSNGTTTDLNPQPTEYQNTTSNQTSSDVVYTTVQGQNQTYSYNETDSYIPQNTSSNGTTTPIIHRSSRKNENNNTQDNSISHKIASLSKYFMSYIPKSIQGTGSGIINPTKAKVTTPIVPANNITVQNPSNGPTSTEQSLAEAIANSNTKAYVLKNPQKALVEYCKNPSQFNPDVLTFICECIKESSIQEQKDIMSDISNGSVLTQIIPSFKAEAILALSQNTDKTQAGSVRSLINESAKKIQEENPLQTFLS